MNIWTMKFIPEMSRNTFTGKHAQVPYQETPS
jgi:hypothetical protein